MAYSLTATGDTSGFFPVGSTLTGFAHASFLSSDPFGVILWHWGRVGMDSGQFAQTSIGVDPSAESSPKTMATAATFTAVGVYDVWGEIVSSDFATQYVEIEIGVVTIGEPPPPIDFANLAQASVGVRLVLPLHVPASGPRPEMGP